MLSLLEMQRFIRRSYAYIYFGKCTFRVARKMNWSLRSSEQNITYVLFLIKWVFQSQINHST